MPRIAVSRPPGVSISITNNVELFSWAASTPRVTKSAVAGPIAPWSRSTVTVPPSGVGSTVAFPVGADAPSEGSSCAWSQREHPSARHAVRIPRLELERRGGIAFMIPALP